MWQIDGKSSYLNWGGLIGLHQNLVVITRLDSEKSAEAVIEI